MVEIVELLNEKNQYLEKFYRLNEAEILNIMEGDFENLEEFYNNREGILNLVHKIDEMIERANNTTLTVQDESPESAEQRKLILKALDYKNELVTRILSQDLQILSCIEAAKSGIIKELAQVKATRKALRSYKSEPDAG